MNRSMIRYILGWVLKIEAVLLLLPCVVAVIYQEEAIQAFLITVALCAVCGFLMTHKKPDNTVFYLKEGCIATALSWIVMSLFGCLPFIISGSIPSFTDALFETISGFTTTGATILADVEILPRSILFWRSFTHWIGGMGVLVFLLAVVPMSGGSNMNLMKAESPGPSVGKLVPKVRVTARILYYIYIGMTITQIVLMVLGGAPLFDAVTISFGTAGTGGFGVRNDSIAGYSPYIQWLVAVFMALFGINFNAYYFLLYRKWKKAFSMEEVRYYFLIMFAVTGIITVDVLHASLGTGHTVRDVFFQVSSLMTSTGFSTLDYDIWPVTSKTLLVMIMFVGACAGSTGGGIKVSRFVILLKTMKKEMNSYMYPKSIRKIRMEGKPVEHEVVRAVNVFFITFMMLFALSILIVSFDGMDMISNFTGVLACLNNIGPGMEMAGPTENFTAFSSLSKYVLMFDMLAGRLELFPMLLLFHPSAWKQMACRKSRG
ncbi:MAG: TrkH family potassium uptake protein [Lachnospiraceae bacterium]|nr:TrkH family potassium uptake protein [Lachnospiraceae bacterium]